uniref:Uncharacterized protein n=1 Tax=Ascaris lumbricoides TaxID=6252 RepID=A0A0M3HZX9_ASCLU
MLYKRQESAEMAWSEGAPPSPSFGAVKSKQMESPSLRESWIWKRQKLGGIVVLRVVTLITNCKHPSQRQSMSFQLRPL